MARVLVTGARRGIGLATSVELARRGHHVLGGVRHASQSDEIAASAADAGVSVEPLVIDVGDPTSIASAAERALAGGPVDVVINNAGINQVSPIEHTDVSVMHDAFAINVIGPMLLAQACIPAMRAQGSGLFVTVSSVASHPRFTPPSFSSVYAASKAAVGCWAESLNKEIAGFGLRSIVVELGSFETDMTEPTQYESSEELSEGPYATVAAVQDESLKRAPRPPAAEAAARLAGLISDPEPPLRSVFPAEIAPVLAQASTFPDIDYLNHCRAKSGRDWARAFRASLTG